jgi:hypothetical protein
MEIHLFDSGDRTPQPRDRVQIEDVAIQPYRDRVRVWVNVKITPFLERPNLLLVAQDQDDQIVAELNIIETMHADMEFTLHLRGKGDPAGSYSLTVELFYETRNPPQDRRVEGFFVPEASAPEDEAP